MADASDRLQRVLDAIDARNADDPHRISVRGVQRPKEQAHAQLMSEWIERLCEAPSEALQIAARAHHLRRWTIARSDYEPGREGYLRWRTDQKRMHARECSAILSEHRFDEATIARVAAILEKKGLRRDPEVQIFEDALCLVFVETQLAELAARTPDAGRLRSIVRKTVAKMSPRAVELAAALPIGEAERSLLVQAATATGRSGSASGAEGGAASASEAGSASGAGAASASEAGSASGAGAGAASASEAGSASGAGVRATRADRRAD